MLVQELLELGSGLTRLQEGSQVIEIGVVFAGATARRRPPRRFNDGIDHKSGDRYEFWRALELGSVDNPLRGYDHAAGSIRHQHIFEPGADDPGVAQRVRFLDMDDRDVRYERRDCDG